MRRTLGAALAAVLFLVSPGTSAYAAVSANISSLKIGRTGFSAAIPAVRFGPASLSVSALLQSRTLSSVAVAPGVNAAAPVPGLSPVPVLAPAPVAPVAAAPGAPVLAGLEQTTDALAEPQAQPAAVLDGFFDSSVAKQGGAIIAAPAGPSAGGGDLSTYSGEDHASPRSGPGSVSPRPVKPSFKERINGYSRGFLTLLRNTAAEVFILGAIGLAVAIGFGHAYETKVSNVIPVGFSEIHQIENDAQYQGKAVGPMTLYSASANDLAMNIFNSWNRAHADSHLGGSAHQFAHELEFHMDPAFKIHHYELFNYLRDIPARADAALKELAPFIALRAGLRPVNTAFSQAWDASHVDHYRTEWYYETVYTTVSDGDGKSHQESHQELRSRQVYDHTTHSYDYHKAGGELASSSLDALIGRTPPLEFKEKLQTASQTNAEGEYEAEKSRREFRDRRPTAEEYKAISDMWATGSTLMANLPGIYQNWRAMPGDADAWRSAKGSAHDDSYNTNSHSDSGPQEYQVAMKALAHGQALESSIGEVVDGITFTRDEIGKLDAKIRALIAVELDGKKGDSERLMKDIMSITRQIYARNFKNGFDVNPYRAWLVVMLAFAGLVGGGATGWALDFLGTRRGWYDKLLRRSRG